MENKYDANIVADFCKSYESMERFRRVYEENPHKLTQRNYINSLDKFSIITPEEILKELGTSREKLERKKKEVKAQEFD